MSETYYVIRKLGTGEYWGPNGWYTDRRNSLRFDTIGQAWPCAADRASPCKIVKVTVKPKKKTITIDKLYELYAVHCHQNGMVRFWAREDFVRGSQKTVWEAIVRTLGYTVVE